MRDDELWPWIWVMLIALLVAIGAFKVAELALGGTAEPPPVRICVLYVQEQVALCPNGATQDTFVPLTYLREAHDTRDSALTVMQRALDWRQR